MNASPSMLPEVLLAAFAEGLVYDEHGKKMPLRAGVLAEEAELLYRLTREVQPEHSLELGLGSGVSTLAILKALDDNGRGTHFVADPLESSYGNSGIAMVERAGLAHRWRFFAQHPEEIMVQIPPVQLVFVDASHLFDLTISGFVLADRKLAVGGIIGFHDLWLPSQQKVLRYILSNRHYRPYNPYPTMETRLATYVERILRRWPRANTILAPEILKPWIGWGLPNLALLQKNAPDDRQWDFHIPF